MDKSEAQKRLRERQLRREIRVDAVQELSAVEFTEQLRWYRELAERADSETEARRWKEWIKKFRAAREFA